MWYSHRYTSTHIYNRFKFFFAAIIVVIKKYICIVKVVDSTGDKFLKYRTNDLIKFTKFLDLKFPDWKWFNVYDKITGEQVANFTINNRPTTRYIAL